MSASETLKARRRPATYGKTFRRPKPEPDSITVDHIVHVANPKTWSLQTFERMGSPDKDTCSAGSHPSTNTTREAKKAIGDHRCAVPLSKQQNCLHNFHAMLLHEEPAHFTSHLDSTAYDVPSSCEETDMMTRESLGRKRRKIGVDVESPGSVPSIEGQNWPKRSLKYQGRTQRNHQRLFPAFTMAKGEQACNQQMKEKRYNKPSFSTVEQDSDQPIPVSLMMSPRMGEDKARHGQQLVKSVKGPDSLCSQRKKIVGAKSHGSWQYSASINHARISEPFDAEDYSTSISPSGNGIEHGSVGRDKTYLSPPRTPSSSPQSKHEVLTPRQLELWSKLLVDESHRVTRTSTDNINLRDADNSTKRSPNWATSVARTDTKGCSASVSFRRRRIVERLRERLEFESHQQILAPSDEDNTIPSVNRAGSDEFRKGVTKDAFSVANNSVAKKVATDSALEAEYPIAPPPRVGGLKLTYARQRSYLAEDSLNAVTSFTESISINTDARQTSQRSVVVAPDPASCLKSQEEPDSNDKSEGGTIRSIHELREAGGNARLASEMETILDDLDEAIGNQTFKRARLLELVPKLREVEYRRYFINQGWEKRLLTHVRPSHDMVTDMLLVAALLYLIAGSSAPPFLDQFCCRRVFVFLLKTMENDTDLDIILKDRKTNISKVTVSDYIAFSQSLKRSAVWRLGAPDSVTLRVCVLQCIEYLIRHVRDVNDMTKVLPQNALDRIIRATDDLSTNLTYSPGRLLSCYLMVSIAEHCTISGTCGNGEQLTATAIAKTAQLLPLVVTWPEKESGNLQTLILRLYLNLTNNNAALCEAFSTQQVMTAICGIVISQFRRTSVAAIMSEQELLLNTLILSLGALINIVECSDAARLLIKDLRSGPNSILDLLLDIFSTKLTETVNASSETETSLNVAFGYLAVLLTCLCVSEGVRTHVAFRLRGKTLHQLLDAVEEFMHYHKEIDRMLDKMDEGRDLKIGFIERLQHIMDRLKRE